MNNKLPFLDRDTATGVLKQQQLRRRSYDAHHRHSIRHRNPMPVYWWWSIVVCYGHGSRRYSSVENTQVSQSLLVCSIMVIPFHSNLGVQHLNSDRIGSSHRQVYRRQANIVANMRICIRSEQHSQHVVSAMRYSE